MDNKVILNLDDYLKLKARLEYLNELIKEEFGIKTDIIPVPQPCDENTYCKKL